MKSAGKSAASDGAGKSGLDPIVQYFIKNRGQALALAAELGITSQAIYQWEKTPANRVLEVEKFTGISRHILRPDIFGEGKVQ